MSFTFIIVIFLIGFAGSYISGMIGIGGSFIKYPMLLYIPTLFGLTRFTAHEVSGISAIQVFFATLGEVIANRKTSYLNNRHITNIGTAILIGHIMSNYRREY